MRGITRGMTGKADTVSLKGKGLYKASVSESRKERLVIKVISVSKKAVWLRSRVFCTVDVC